MKNVKEISGRLSLEDFKMNKVQNQNEIDKLMGTAAAMCHPGDPTNTTIGDFTIKADHDY